MSEPTRGAKLVISKPGLVILAAAAGALVWVEHANRTRIEPLSPAETARQAAAAACPTNDSAPFSEACLTMIGANATNATPRDSINATSRDNPASRDSIIVPESR